jgi:hypothetical protein
MPNKLVRARQRQSVADANADVDRLDREVGDCAFSDERLGKRFRSLLEQLSSNLGDSIPLVCQDRASTKAAYRFLDNDRVGEAEILAGRFEATRDRFAATDGPILVLHDTTEFSFKRGDVDAVGITRKCVAGAYCDGAIRYYAGCGILMHSRLGVTTEGLRTGQRFWAMWSSSPRYSIDSCITVIF